jgi:hypothetical protein
MTDLLDTARYCDICGEPVDGSERRPSEPASFQTSKRTPTGVFTKKMESHLLKAIFAAACCCNPLGIVAIYFSAQVGPNVRAHKRGAALEASKKANLWANLAIGMGILIQILWVAFYKVILESEFFQMLRTATTTYIN